MRARRLTRSQIDRVLGGVCGGLAATIGIDAWWVRVAFLVLGAFTAGTGALIYLALWWVMPPQTLDDLRDANGSRSVIGPRPETVILLGGVTILMGLVVLARSLGMLDGANGDAFLPLVILVFALLLALNQLRRTAA